MHRPTRQLENLVRKIQAKESRAPKRSGKRLKQWRKWAEQYKPVSDGQASQS